ncbi:hypothetical protein B0H10DRAFT_2237165 [Mycena sp. CBHHK59/15]|nr:hypothetical protein B0H10DRAFT_2237165 [Mycena sp. CBHHK59/15]
MSVSTHTGSSLPSYRSEVPFSIRSGSLVDSVSTRTVFSPPSYRSAPLPPLPAPPPPPPSLFTAPDYAVHYRIYTPSGAVPVKAAASRPDPFVGRILARSGFPFERSRWRNPEGAAGVAIVPIFALGAVIGVVSYITIRNAKTQSTSQFTAITAELQLPSPPSPYQSITSTSETQIYASMYDSAPMRDDAAVVLTGDGRHGASSDNPVAVVFLEELSVKDRKARDRRLCESRDSARQIRCVFYLNSHTRFNQLRAVYYRLYNCDGETPSSAAFDSVHTALGRIERAHITPPATVDSLKSCIVRVEHKRIWKYADLYEGTAPRDPLWAVAPSDGRWGWAGT